MHTYLLTPLAPLVLRTGKPFGDTGGGDNFPFPQPSTLAGALRTARADAEGLPFSPESRDEVLGWASHGALPAKIEGDTVTPLFPRPLDVHYTKPGESLVLDWLAPKRLGEDEGCDLPAGLWPVFLRGDDKAKPAKGPVWWTQAAMEGWLRGQLPETKDLGHEALPLDFRQHVKLDPNTLASETGQLFQSAGIDFEARRKTDKPEPNLEKRGWNPQRFGLLARFSHELQPTLLRLGADARLAAAVMDSDAWPKLPPELAAALRASKAIRLILATPALFSGGWKPGWLGDDLTGSPPGVPGLTLRLCAAALDRWQAVSGWEIVKKKPKAVRRTVPAGAVYWFEIVGDAPDNWPEQLWLSPISDHEQDRRDGFGLALPGIWKQ
ncbi:type III-B CRISPR module-associated Cmr3 family protein [Candidatus Methylocalor cossyra]|uniref:CRISPR type III-B/RAMP module-associated protein Cmr3 n=1 Tax=Candidatus Methylocalor cossyra TaxID=3108543 RepID=A0ABM9NK92_9GAMM